MAECLDISAPHQTCTCTVSLVVIIQDGARSRVVDPHRFTADPDPAFFQIADPDTDPDLVPNPGF
jgi:hypothetical protein